MTILEDSISELDRPDFEPNLTRPRHGWYPFKEGYSSSLVANFLMDHTNRTPGIIVDPFGGCGTTALEAATWGWSAITAEVNPFMAFLCRAKCVREYDAKILWREYRRVRGSQVHRGWRLPRDTTLVERKGLDKWLLNRSVAERYETLRTAIENEVHDPNYRRLLTLALILATTRAANARRDGKCWRYKSTWTLRRYSRADVDTYFDEAITSYAHDVQILGRLPGAVRVHHVDCRTWLAAASSKLAGRVDVVLTSPPYLNSFDYTDIYRPECLLLGAARSSDDLRQLRFKTLRSHVQVDWPAAPPVDLNIVRSIVRRLGKAKLWDRRIPEMVNAYFFDIEQVLRESRKCMRKGGTLGLVVADSAYNGIIVPVDKIIAQLASRVGFASASISVLREMPGNGHHQNRSSRCLRESLIVARAE